MNELNEIPATPKWPGEAPITRLMAIFREEFSKVSFPDASLELLEESGERVSSAEAVLTKAQAAVELARAALDEARGELLQRSRRALAYARVYAEDSPELTTHLDGVLLPSTVTSPARAAVKPEEGAPRRRGRPPKSANAAVLLFETPGPVSAPANENAAAAAGQAGRA